MTFRRGEQEEERDWPERGWVTQAEHDDLLACLGGEPEGDWVLIACHGEGNGEVRYLIVGPNTD